MLVLGGVLSLTTADLSTIGAAARQLEISLHINNVDIGLLVTASRGIGVLTTLPFGVLADRVRRVRLRLVSIVVWSVMVAACAAAPTHGYILAGDLVGAGFWLWICGTCRWHGAGGHRSRCWRCSG